MCCMFLKKKKTSAIQEKNEIYLIHRVRKRHPSESINTFTSA